MATNKQEDTTDPEEQKVWDEVADIILNTAKTVHNVNFLKYKLNYQLQCNQMQGQPNNLNSKKALNSSLANVKTDIGKFQDSYHISMDKLNKLTEKYESRPRIQLILDSAKHNMQKLAAFERFHPPQLENIEEQILNLPEAESLTPDQDDVAPSA